MKKNINRIEQLTSGKKEILSVYFTAGYPERDSAPQIIKALSEGGADLIEIGIPFSDPVADGPVIQHSGSSALRNGMSVELLFSQLARIREITEIPLIIMTYINPVLRFGFERFCLTCHDYGIDGLIIPDLTPEQYQADYEGIFSKYGLCNIMMIAPSTGEERIREIDRLSSGFIYMVSASTTTGMRKGFSENQAGYFSRIKKMNLKNPLLIGFGIGDPGTFRQACSFASGAIVGSAFVRMLGDKGSGQAEISNFVSLYRKSDTSIS